MDQEDLMATDINKRLAQLRARRDGSDRLTMDSAVQNEILSKALGTGTQTIQESWEKRASIDSKHTLYALGAMQPVSATYTRVSVETAERIGNQLRSRLGKAGIDAEFRLQGSVPLDVHIRRVSDVDLLTIDTGFLVYSTSGVQSQAGYYLNTSKNSLSVLQTLRKQIEIELPLAFPQAIVDTTGAKAVKIHGGSLPRMVDVVPAHWYDTNDYQANRTESDRGIQILDKKAGISLTNFPFLHIRRIIDKCNNVGGGLRKAIRLCKNVKADAESEGNAISLPSFDIASMMYHADVGNLAFGQYFELMILAEAQRHLDVLARNNEYAETLMVPDGSRRIIDTPAKWRGLLSLSLEMDDLLRRVAAEHGVSGSLEDCRNAIRFLNQ
ncbi:hypothetical protein [Achromobacter ruhlandii]|nr:hypothetical protein [Achromobacter ruhlandii]MCZ8435279.1 hypothetical protein [Achromobacter ruhlandii]MDC6091039.1 hypothetical protein [Achromobacter ruhlandii]MDC6149971.1 hypothetical protein [Achromobacter ruhlandii]MDD7981279.1 hypothetical protein [Achromobacter ruhlandii]WIW00401.1 hypothetical protein PPH40_014790 [Achromobacter ruhlandii]